MTTMKDIARKAGVSSATVSRIINGKGEAKAETIARVEKIVEELNYRPNSMAKSLRQKKSRMIAILVPNLSNPFFGELASSIDRVASKNGFRVTLCNTDDSREKVEYFLNNIVENYVSGAVVSTLQVTENDLDFLETNGVRTVTIDRSYFDHPYSAINIDQSKGTYIATKYLIKRGSKKIVFICGPQKEKMSTDRIDGYRKALNSRNLYFNQVEYGDYSLLSGYKIAKNLLNQGINFDGIHAANDLMALGAARCCLDHQMMIPDQVKVVGNDNLAIDNYLSPRLTSLSQINEDVSSLVIEELTNLQDKNYKPKKVLLKPKLVVRETT